MKAIIPLAVLFLAACSSNDSPEIFDDPAINLWEIETTSILQDTFDTGKVWACARHNIDENYYSVGLRDDHYSWAISLDPSSMNLYIYTRTIDGINVFNDVYESFDIDQINSWGSFLWDKELDIRPFIDKTSLGRGIHTDTGYLHTVMDNVAGFRDNYICAPIPYGDVYVDGVLLP